MKKSRKIATLHFLEKFCTTGSKNDEKWKNMIKQMIPEMIKKNEDDKINDKKWWMQW